MSTATVTVTTEIEIDVDMAAQWFAGVSDEEQTQFFKKVCEYARQWKPQPGCFHINMESQWMYVGAHLADCDCSSNDARDMIDAIHYAMHERMDNPRPKVVWQATPDTRTIMLTHHMTEEPPCPASSPPPAPAALTVSPYTTAPIG